MNEEQIGTLHALCYRAMGRPTIVSKSHLKDWNAEHPTFAFEGGAVSDLDDPYGDADAGGAKDGDRIAQDYHRLRGLLIPQEEWPVRVQWFADAWQDFKDQTHTVDFTDLIAMSLTERARIPNAAQVFFLDEVQDFSPLELALARHWGSQAEKVYLAGDDDQASLPGSKILTEGGAWVNVEQLNPAQHRLVSYDLRGSSLNGLRRGHQFIVQPSEYAGVVHTVISAAGSTRTTHNHPWVARWTEAARGKTVVYLMRKGNSFRVGWCQLFNADNSCHLFIRATQEQADAAWILRVCETRAEASLHESYAAAEYGLSTVLWRPIHDQSRGYYSKEIIGRLFSMLGNQVERARVCLKAYDRDMDCPLYRRGGMNRGGAKSIQTAACNLLPGYMEIPNLISMDKNGVQWKPIEAIGRHFQALTVYALSVPPYHTYIADNLITHNCLYRFKGAVPDTFLSPELPADQVQVLAQSYRIPRAVHAAAVRWIEGVDQRMPKDYQPRQADGLVETLPITYKYLTPIKDQLEEWLSEGKRVAFLASCSFFVDPVKHQLREWGVPFHNPYRKQRGDWNPLAGRAGTVTAADRLLAFRKVKDAGQWWTYRDLWTWAATLEADEVFARGAKTAMRRKAEDEATAGVAVATDDLETWMPGDEAADAATGGDVDWLRAKLLSTYQKPMAYASAVLQARGSAALTGRPLVSIGTIHSYKGGEADVVVLFPDLSPAGYREWTTPGDAQDSVRRMIYVGMTRAREALYWAQPCGLSIGGYL